MVNKEEISPRKSWLLSERLIEEIWDQVKPLDGWEFT